MKKIIYLTLCFFTLINATSYTQINSIETYDGSVYSIGDTILAGSKGSPYSPYLTISELTDKKKLAPYKEDIAFDALVISSIVSTDEVVESKSSSTDTLAVVTNISDNKTLYVNLNNAIRRKEVVAAPAVRLFADVPMATLSDFQIACIKTNDLPVNDFRIKYYIKSADKELGERCERDEFEYHEVKDKYKAEIEERIKHINFNKIYYIDQPMGMGEYNFDEKAYPVSFNKIESKGFLKYEDFYCSIPNMEAASLFPLVPGKARRVNKLRYYAHSPKPNPLVFARCYFRFLDERMEIKKTSQFEFEKQLEDKYRSSLVGIEIVGMEFYTEPHLNYNFLGSVEIK